MAYAFSQGKPVYIPFKAGISVLKSNFDVKVYTDPKRARQYNPKAKIVKYVPEADDAVNVIPCKLCDHWQVDPSSLRVYCTSPKWSKKRETSPDEYCSDAIPRKVDIYGGDI